MAFLNCECRCNCTPLAFVASLIIGIIAAFLQITAVITVAPAFLWVLLGIAVGFLAIGLLTPCCRRDDGCSCFALSGLLVGALGTALIAVVLLGVTFAATSVVGAIFIGLLLFFFAFLLSSAACLIRARCND